MESTLLEISTTSVKILDPLNSLNMNNLFLLTAFALGLGFFILLLVWSFVWKGFALWKAAKNNQKWWFIAILLINTVGILEILYLFIFSPNKFSLKKTKNKEKQSSINATDNITNTNY